jgi:hypothetical protein
MKLITAILFTIQFIRLMRFIYCQAKTGAGIQNGTFCITTKKYLKIPNFRIRIYKKNENVTEIFRNFIFSRKNQ